MTIRLFLSFVGLLIFSVPLVDAKVKAKKKINVKVATVQETESEKRKKLVAEHAVLSLTKPDSSVSGPLFSQYTLNNATDILTAITYSYSYYIDTTSKEAKDRAMEQLAYNLCQFARAEYKKKKIVLFHGQQSQWAFLERCCNELCYLKYGFLIPETFVRLRFADKLPLSDKEVTEIRTQGIDYTKYGRYSSAVLFVNLHFLANYIGSNSFYFVRSNSDCSASSYGTPYALMSGGLLETMFTEFGLAKEYQAALQVDKDVFIKLFELYNDVVKAAGNVGRFLAISLPKPLAKRLVYSTWEDGRLEPITINGKATTDIVEISENFNHAPFFNEHCLILSKEICDLKEAQKAGVIIKGFDAFDRACEAYKKFDTKFKALMKQIAQGYIKRNPTLAERIKRYATELVGLAQKNKVAAAA